jgi:hypothetical protein
MDAMEKQMPWQISYLLRLWQLESEARNGPRRGFASVNATRCASFSPPRSAPGKAPTKVGR